MESSRDAVQNTEQNIEHVLRKQEQLKTKEQKTFIKLMAS